MAPTTRSSSKPRNILITGASGYLGGTLLARWSGAKLPHNKLYALVRTPEQAEAIKQYEAEPLDFDVLDTAATEAAIIDNNISVVYFLIDSFGAAKWQLPMIKALATVKRNTGQEVHFLNTSGAKLFSSHTGLPTLHPLLDSDPGLYDLQTQAQARSYWPMIGQALESNNRVIKTAEEYGVRCYVFIPCIVYGPGEGFGNKISIQTVAIVNTARKLGRVYQPDPEEFSWPVCHVVDNTTLYLEIIRNILSEKDIPHGKNGYYLAASGTVAWKKIYTEMAKGLAKRKVTETETVDVADSDVLDQMAAAIGCPKDIVTLFLGGDCSLTAKNGLDIGWKPQYPAEHILEMADAEVELILQKL
ncbi:hypothetical protein N7495_006850 [Penicillium taxi]|uniref:uncharacterized protein n=1 Tax=Penicillium taxi TaxID=168475 RepID=UPI002544D8F2|nr:uncharacterized protein N7495_006850 [Penicillium taxi]KAJ5895159.1 hypothetical protein N7495_006850 [Penicillium taxi]